MKLNVARCLCLEEMDFWLAVTFFFFQSLQKTAVFATLVSFLLKAFNLCMKKKETQETKYHNDNHLY